MTRNSSNRLKVDASGALEAIARINHAGHVVVATNQSGLGRGLLDVASLNAMHAKMHKLLARGVAGWMQCFTPRRTTNAIALTPACLSKSASAMALT